MKMIDTKTLISEINSKKDNEFTIELEGIITAKIEIKNLEIKKEKNTLTFLDKDKNEKIKILKYQIMKIKKTEKEYIIRFDALQNLKIEV